MNRSEMKAGKWAIVTYQDEHGFHRDLMWFSTPRRLGDTPGEPTFGPFESRDRARRVALFHALWLDGLLTEKQAVAMLEGRADVAGGQRTADEAPDETVRLVHRLGAAADGDCDTAGDNDCDGVDAHADLWAKVRAALEAEGFDFDALVERAAETLEHWRRNPWRGDVAAAGLDGLGAGDERDDDCDGVIDDARRGVLAARAGAAALAAREAQVEPSRPEPPPVNRGEPVTPPLLAWLRAHGFEDEARAVEARDAFGREKYGQPLMTFDGRDPIEDARQELADALQYVQRAAMLGADLTPLAGLLDALCARTIDAQRERGCA